MNTYLTDVRIPSTYPEPVTLRSLMDHTAGFEDRVIGTGARTAGDVPALGEFLAANQPARIRPVGEVSAYSNYGAALAGHIVAEVSGEPYDVYIGRHLFDPLDMTHSTASEPVPAGLVVVLRFLVAALTALAVPAVWLWRFLARRPATTTTPWRVARVLAAGAAMVGVVFIVALGAVLFGDTGEFLYGVPVSFRLILFLPLAVLALTGAAATCTRRRLAGRADGGPGAPDRRAGRAGRAGLVPVPVEPRRLGLLMGPAPRWRPGADRRHLERAENI